MKTRIIAALLVILCIVPPPAYGGWLADLLVVLIIVAGGIELLSLKEQDAKWPLGIKTLAIVAAFVLVLSGEWLHVALLGVSAFIFLFIPVFTDRFHAKGGFLCVAYVTLFFTIACCFLHVYGANRMYVWFIIIAAYACDTAAYFCGRLSGKHKLNVCISPKKTREDSIGGWLFGALLSFTSAWFMINTMTPLQMMIASAILTVTGRIGDLASSVIKHNFGIKGFSDLLPGHGSVLDRVDFLVFNFICFDLILVVLML